MPAFIPPIRVEPLWFPLVKKFYQAYYASGKPNKSEPIWVIKEGPTIIAAVRLKGLQHCQLLTALVTHPAYRGQGHARHLVTHLQPSLATQPSFCINQPELETFYHQCGFQRVLDEPTLPDEITGRLRRYRIKQPNLIVMQYQSV